MKEEKPDVKQPTESEVIFIKSHEHAGKHYQAGDVITVSEPEKQLLKQFGAI